MVAYLTSLLSKEELWANVTLFLTLALSKLLDTCECFHIFQFVDDFEELPKLSTGFVAYCLLEALFSGKYLGSRLLVIFVLATFSLTFSALGL